MAEVFFFLDRHFLVFCEQLQRFVKQKAKKSLFIYFHAMCLLKKFVERKHYNFMPLKSGTMIKKSFSFFLPILKAYSLNIQLAKF